MSFSFGILASQKLCTRCVFWNTASWRVILVSGVSSGAYKFVEKYFFGNCKEL